MQKKKIIIIITGRKVGLSYIGGKITILAGVGRYMCMFGLKLKILCK